MIYLLKFGASLVLPPGIFFVVMVLLTLRLWHNNDRRAGRALAALTLLFYLLSTNIVADVLVKHLEYAYEPPERVDGDVIIMLGGGAVGDSRDVSGAGNLTNAAANRLLTAVRLQRLLQTPVIVAGGQVYADSGREAVIAERLLQDLGVDASLIIVEDQSLNTKQNAANVAAILARYGFKRPVLVTSAFHMPRAVLNFDKLNIAVTPYPAGYTVNPVRRFHYNQLAPSADALAGSCTVLRELLGLAAAKLVK